MNHPVVRRELTGALQTRKALSLQIALAIVFTLVVASRWPTDARVDLSGAQSRHVFRAVGYALAAAVILLAGVFPAISIVREKNQGTLSLLLVSPLAPWSIYAGKLAAMVGIGLVLLAPSLPAVAACYALGGIALVGDVLVLYGILFLALVQYAALGLWVSSHAATTDSALRITYGLILMLAIVTLGPHLFLQGTPGWKAEAADGLRAVSPIPAIMEVLGQADVGGRGLASRAGPAGRYALVAVLSTAFFAAATISRLSQTMLDRARAAGIMTQDRGIAVRVLRRLLFLVDPQRRTGSIPPYLNPVMVKEFRCRRFGRMHWLLRLVSACALLSLGLTYAATMGTLDWGVQTIGGILVVMQTALVVLFTPSIAAGLISTEIESGGWDLLKMTPLSAATVVRGKLMSVLLTVALILLATLPGYAVMVFLDPKMLLQVQRVIVCMLVTAGFAVIFGAAVSSLFRRTAPAMATCYAVLLALWAGTMLIWLGRDAPFGHRVVERALSFNPMATALSVIKAPGFEIYNLIPANWWWMGAASAVCALVLVVRTWLLTRPL